VTWCCLFTGNAGIRRKIRRNADDRRVLRGNRRSNSRLLPGRELRPGDYRETPRQVGSEAVRCAIRSNQAIRRLPPARTTAAPAMADGVGKLLCAWFMGARERAIEAVAAFPEYYAVGRGSAMRTRFTIPRPP
jgi:hypothetical protein